MSGQGGLIKTHRRCQSVATPCSGFATLVIALILLMVATIAVLTVARAGVFEQRYAGIDIRSKEVHAAAAGGLEFGIQWFEANWAELVWPSGAAGEVAVSPSPAAELPVTEAGADSYRLDVGYELLTALDAAPGAMPVVVRAVATASAVADSHVTKTVSADLLLGRVGLFHGGDLLDAPPVVVEDCIIGVTGHTNIHPHDSVAIGTAGADSGCINTGNADLNGGGVVALAEPRTLSEAIFGLPQQQVEARLREIERREPQRVYVIDLNDSNNPPAQPGYSLVGGRDGDWQTSLDDSRYRPYILYFTAQAGCPRISGNTNIHGLVYYAATGCDSHAWGNGNIHGTVAVSGSIAALSGNATVRGQAWDYSERRSTGSIDPGLAMVEIIQLLGSWRDF